MAERLKCGCKSEVKKRKMTENRLFFGRSGAGRSPDKLDNDRDNRQVSISDSNKGNDIACFFTADEFPEVL